MMYVYYFSYNFPPIVALILSSIYGLINSRTRFICMHAMVDIIIEMSNVKIYISKIDSCLKRVKLLKEKKTLGSDYFIICHSLVLLSND